MTRDEIFTRVRELLAQSFDIAPERITPTALLFQDLDLDSIDAIDMVVSLQEWTGRRVAEESLRGVRTVDDVVSLVEVHLAAAPPAGEGEGPGQAGP